MQIVFYKLKSKYGINEEVTKKMKMKKIKWIISILLIVQSWGLSGQIELENKLSLNGYMDVLYLGAAIPSTKQHFSYLTTHRVNLIPKFKISPKLEATMLIECADLFRLDEADLEEEPGIIEWAYLTYKHNNWLNVKAGTFAIPFGIYNERFYASPSQLTSFLPASVYFQHRFGEGDAAFTDFAFPRNPSGVQVFGKLLKVGNHHINYATYFTNEAAGESVTSIGKYVGGRLTYESTSDLIKLGSSYCTYLQSGKVAKNALGVDLQLKVHNFQLQSEFLLSEIGKRDTLQMILTDQFYKSTGAYVQLGYTIKDIVTPYVRYDYFNPLRSVQNDAEMVMVGGVNVAIHAQVVWKAEAYILDYEDKSINSVPLLISTLAIAF